MSTNATRKAECERNSRIQIGVRQERVPTRVPIQKLRRTVANKAVGTTPFPSREHMKYFSKNPQRAF